MTAGEPELNLISVQEAAQRAGVHVGTVHNYLSKGRLQRYRRAFDGRTYVNTAELDALLEPAATRTGLLEMWHPNRLLEALSYFRYPLDDRRAAELLDVHLETISEWVEAGVLRRPAGSDDRVEGLEVYLLCRWRDSQVISERQVRREQHRAQLERRRRSMAVLSEKR